jgi:hypothetical protein
MLKEAYRRWKDSRGGSVDHWMSICDENIKFGSLAQGAPRIAYLTSYSARDELARYFEGLAKDWEMIDYRVDALGARMIGGVLPGECSWRYKANGKVIKTRKSTLALRPVKAVRFTNIATPRRCKRRPCDVGKQVNWHGPQQPPRRAQPDCHRQDRPQGPFPGRGDPHHGVDHRHAGLDP